jgi:hypothetical protein
MKTTVAASTAKPIRRHRMLQQDGMVAILTREETVADEPTYKLCVTRELGGTPVVIKQHIFKSRSNRSACSYMQYWLDKKFPVTQQSTARQELENLFS